MSEYPTSIGRSDADSITVLGHDLAGELMGQVGFGELAFWLVAQRRPSAGELRVFEAVLVALADHGLTPSAIAARLTLTGAPESLQGARRRRPARRRIALPRGDRGLRPHPGRRARRRVRRAPPDRRRGLGRAGHPAS